MQKLRLGMIGAGKTAIWHLKSYKKMPNVEIVAIANPFSCVGEKLAEKYKARHFVNGFDLIEKADVDVIDICTPTGLHKDFIIMALNKGLHVYTEKPIGTSIEEIEEVIAANRTAHKIIFNGFNYRFLPEFCKIRSIINSGKLGEIRYIRIIRTTKENPNSYMFRPDSCGLFNEFHCHFVDLIFSFGFVNPEKVFAYGTTVHEWKINPDTATMVLFYPHNTIVEITTSLASPGLSPEMLIVGREGTLRFNYGRVSFVKKKDIWPLHSLIMLMLKEAMIVPFGVLKNPFQGSCEHFINCVMTGNPSEYDEMGALKTFKITSLAEKSYLENKTILIETN